MAILFKAFLLLPLLFLSSVIAKRPGLGWGGKLFGGASASISFGAGGVNYEFHHNDGTSSIAGGNVGGTGDYPDYDPNSKSSKNDGSDESPENMETISPFDPTGKPGKPDFKTNYMGVWKIENPNVGVSAMQLQLMPNNKAVWFDTTALGDSARKLDPPGYCPVSLEKNNAPDCFAHGVAYDVDTGDVRTLKMDGDPWCSSGSLSANGDLIATGGANKGIKSVRVISPCDDCQFSERQNALGDERWYASNQILEDGSIMVVGGRKAFSYEIIPPQLNFEIKRFDLPFLEQTTDPVENNLYPFLYLIPDGNVFLFANNRAILLNPLTGQTVREYPVLLGGSRNYPASGMSALLPLKLTPDDSQPVDVEVVVCGGNKPEAFAMADLRHTQQKVFLPALQDCSRINVLKPDATWEKEQDMPSPRVMGDMLFLPTGDLLMINGAKKGASGWLDADEPNYTPVVYSPYKPMGERFKELKPTQIPRMYHSSSAVLPNGQILVVGSNPNNFYTYDNVPYPTELRVEKFSPHYLDRKLAKHRPEIVEESSERNLKYGVPFNVAFNFEKKQKLGEGDIKVTMLMPPFTTHGFSQNQRLLILGMIEMTENGVTVVAPPSGKIAPPGYYLLYVVHRGVPSRGMWVHIG